MNLLNKPDTMIDVLSTVDLDRIHRVFEAQRKHQLVVAASAAGDRIQKLRKLLDAFLKYRKELRESLWKDYRRPAAEVDLVELYAITTEIKFAIRHLKRWMRPKRVGTPLALFGSSSWIQFEPKGVCLIIGPYNYPVQLAIGPLVSAIAAGNTAILKPSENTPNSSALMTKILSEVFDENEVAVFEGNAEVTTALLEMPFNHIAFTGSPQVGKIVMTAAAKHLASVTLELGGKSPTIIDETADIQIAARRVTWVKFQNNGQVCLAPDYVMVHSSRLSDFVDAVKQTIREYFGDDPSKSDSYMRLVNARHFERAHAYVKDARQKGADIVYGGDINAAENYLAPTVLVNPPRDSKVMMHEIFGPIMPVIPYSDLQEVIDLIRSKEDPLALYIYSKSKRNINRILKSTRAGATCINNNGNHFFNPHLPFGGINNSGMGKIHGHFGFVAFSNERAIYKQVLPTALDKLVPPYTDKKLKFIEMIIKWL